MSSLNTLLCITISITVIATITYADMNCTVGHSVGTQLSIESKRNDSGHWVSQVDLIHSDSGEAKGDPWTVDVHHRTTSCGDDSPGEVVIGATLISPRFVVEEEPGNNTKRIIGENLGDIGVHHRYDATIKFKFSNSSASWYHAREDCDHYNCSLLQSEFHSRTTLSYVQDFVKSNGLIHMGFQQKSEPPYDFVDLNGNFKSHDDIGSNWAAGQPPSKSDASAPTCVTYDGRYLSTGSCKDRHHFMCVCHKEVVDSEEHDDY